MQFYTAGLLSEGEKFLLRKVREAVGSLPDNPNLGLNSAGTPFIYSCHILARAVSRVFALTLVDGTYSEFKLAHSWVVTPNGNYIDPYPIGIYSGNNDGPVLACMETGSPQRVIYHPDSGHSILRKLHDEHGRDEFEQAVIACTQLLEAVVARRTDLIM